MIKNLNIIKIIVVYHHQEKNTDAVDQNHHLESLHHQNAIVEAKVHHLNIVKKHPKEKKMNIVHHVNDQDLLIRILNHVGDMKKVNIVVIIQVKDDVHVHQIIVAVADHQ